MNVAQAFNAGWERLSRPSLKAARWRHPSGWEIHHCGHQTALWPYSLVDPAHPEAITTAPNGRGYRLLAEAFDAVSALLAGAAETFAVGWSTQYAAEVRRVRGRR